MVRLGINTSRLPVDGKALVFNVSRLALIHHRQPSSIKPEFYTRVIVCGRVALYRVVIEDATGQRLPERFLFRGSDAWPGHHVPDNST